MPSPTEQTDRPSGSNWFQTVALVVTAVIALVIAALTLAPSVSPPPMGLALTDTLTYQENVIPGHQPGMER